MLNNLFRWFEQRVDPYPEAKSTVPQHGFYPFLISSIAGTKRWFFVMMIFTGLLGIFEAYLFSMMGHVVDWLSHYSPQQLWQKKHDALLLMASIVALSFFVVAVQSLLKFQTLQGNLPMRLRWNFHRLMLAQPLQFYHNEFAGRIAAKVMQTAIAVRDTMMTFTNMMVYLLVYFLTSAIILADFDFWFLLPFILWLFVFAYTLYFFIPKLSNIAKAQANARATMTGRITDAYTNISTIKLFSHNQRESGYAKEAMHEFLDTVHQQMRLASKLELTNHMINMSLVAITASVGIYLWMKGQTSVGAIAASTAMALRLNGLSHWIMWELAGLFENVGTVRDGMSILTIAPQITDHKQAQPLTVTQGKIEFNDVSFYYNPQRYVFDRFNLTINPGEKIGIVGRSGAGKSTLVNLLLRFYELGSGRVLIDGQDVSMVTQDSLRKHIGMVTQDTSLLHRSLRDNIVYGKPDASDSEVAEALRRAQATSFMLELQDREGRKGLDAYVGERGVKLSGGQRQRIAIARVLLKNAPILLLDEATSALDSEVEQVIQQALHQLMQGKTVIAIAHRLSTIARMDRLVIIDNGQIIEQGTHIELLEKQGLYAQLWQRQVAGFIATE